MLYLTEMKILKILTTCKEISENNNKPINVSEKLKNKSPFKKYDAALRSLNKKGYFDEFDYTMSGVSVVLSTKGFEYKADTLIGFILQIFGKFIIPITIGIISAVITAHLV